MKKEEKKQSSLKVKKLKNNSYNAVMIVVVLAIVIIVNLIADKLPAKYTKWDATGSDVYGITDETVKFIHKLEQDVTIYYIVKSGSEVVEIQTVLDKYADESSHIKVENVDPSLHPAFVSKYEADSSAIMIVESGERYKILSSEDIMSDNSEEYYYGTVDEYKVEFTGENAITSAIQYVTTEDLPKMYVLQEHQELGLDDTAKGYVEDSNVQLEDLSLIKQEKVPEDCDCLLIASPKIDISSDEKDKILDYLKNGGNAIFILDYMEKETPNLDEVLKYYSLQLQKGIVVENDNGYYMSYPYYLIPEVASSDITTSVKENNQTMVVPNAQGIKTLEDARDTVTIKDVLTTSNKSYLKSDPANATSLEQDMSDATGSFSIATIVTESEESDKADSEDEDDAIASEITGEDISSEETEYKTKLAVFTSYAIVDSSINSQLGNANLSVFLDAVGWMCEYEDSIIIPGKQLTDGYLTISSADAIKWSVLYIFIIPIAFIAIGIVVCIRRRIK